MAVTQFWYFATNKMRYKCTMYQVSIKWASLLNSTEYILLVQPVFVKSILCAIYGPICKLAKKILGKKILNVTTVKLLLKNKIQCFWGFLMPFCFKLYLKVNIHISRFFTCYCLKMASKIGNISKFHKMPLGFQIQVG